MILDKENNELDCFADLMRQDHIYLIRGFSKGLGRSINSLVVTDILSRYVPRRRICGLTDPSGKPRLQPVDGKTIFISLAHVEDILLMVLATDVDVGIDVEVIRHRRFARQIAARYFDYEPTTLHEFYRAWTAREAFIKAIGSGIGSDLARIRTKKCGPYLEIGLDRHYSHMVSFFTPLDNVVAALCRPQSAKRGFTMITN